MIVLDVSTDDGRKEANKVIESFAERVRTMGEPGYITTELNNAREREPARSQEVHADGDYAV